MYLDSDNNWITYGKMVAPLNFGDTIKAEVTTAYAITLYFKGTKELALEELKPGTICKIDFVTRKDYFVITDGGKIESKTGVSYGYHSYTLQELIAVTREISIQTAYFSFNEYTVAEFFTRLLALADSDLTIDIDTTGDYQTLLDNWQKADFQVSSNSLLDNLIKIGLNNKVRVKARLNASKHIELYFRSLEGTEVIAEIDGELISNSKQYMGVTYASKALAQITNLTDDKFQWVPYADVYKGIKVLPESNDATAITADTATLKLTSKIKLATKVRVLGRGAMVKNSSSEMSGYTGSDYRVFTHDGTRLYPDASKYVDWDYNLTAPALAYKEYNVISFEEWKTLDPDDSNSATIHQENTLYFKRGENKIFNMKICDGQSSVGFNQRAYYVEVWYGGALISTTNLYPKLVWYQNKHIVSTSLMGDALISVENKNTSKRATYYSQEDNLVAGDALVQNMKNYIASMQNAEETLTYKFDYITRVPIAGEIYNGKVIASVICNAYYAHIEATLIMSDDLVKKSEYMSADDGLTLPEIDPNKAYNRFTNYKTRVWFSKTLTQAGELLTNYGSDSYFNKTTYLSYILDAITNNRTGTAIGFAEVNIKTSNADATLYTAGQVEIKTIGNLFVALFKTQNNVSIGYIIDDNLGDDFDDLKIYPVAFIAGTGFSESLDIKFRTGLTDNANYPAISEAQFNSTSGAICTINDDKYYHDPAEVINVSYEIEGNTYDVKGYVKSIYWDESGLVKDVYSNGDIYIRAFKFYNEAGTLQFSGFVTTVTVTPVTGDLFVFYVLATTSLANGTPGHVVFERMLDGTYTEPELMMKTGAEIYENSGNKYIRYYVTITK